MRVYVAGKISDSNIIACLNNIREGINASVKVMLNGMQPFSPFIDFQFTFALKENEQLTVEDYYKYSMAWLEVSDVIYVTPGWEDSKGTIAEIKRAEELKIPVVYSFKDLLYFRDNMKG